MLVGGCASLTQISERVTRISEEGGLLGGALSREASSDVDDSQSDTSPSPGDARLSEPGTPGGIPVPYRPADFRERAADGEFAWHWTATRAGERVEVKGLIENRGTHAVQGVRLALSSPDSQVRAEAPGVIRPGQLRPFYFSAVFPGDERQARLSIVAVRRNAVEPEAPPAPRREGPAPARSTAGLFTDQARDNFFTLRWKTMKKGGEIEVSGLLENRNGPMLQRVTLLVSAYGAGDEILKTQQLLFWGPFERKGVRPFAATLPVAREPERVSVSVASYDFFHPSGGK